MHWTFRKRLRAIIVLTGITLMIMVLVDATSMWKLSHQLTAIQGEYLPLLDLGPAVQSGFTGLSRGLQEATTAQDPDAQAATVKQKDQLLALLDRAPPIVEREALAELRSDLNDWFNAAYNVSTRLIRGETGEAIVNDIAAMQAKQRRVQDEIDSTVVLDRRRLTAAFAEARRVQAYTAWIHLLVPIGLTIAVTALVLGMSRRVVQALAELSAGFERFGRGDFSQPVPVAGNDEVSEVARNANQMAAQLRELNEQLLRRQSELERANKELEAFSYSVSHDLRAPLRSIDGFSQAILEDYSALLPAEGQDYLGRVRAAAQRMAQLIDDILRLSRVTRGELHLKSVDLSALARDVAGELARAQPDRVVGLSIQPGLSAQGDPQLLRIVLENLLGNAWKFASKVEHPKIQVGTVNFEGKTAFFVRDNGAGFDMAQTARLFTPFQRLHREAEFPGTGIGLATVQRIIHRHGGQVWAEAAVGQGATFYFTLPRGERP